MIHLIDLPYAEGALEPYISAQTLKYHYGSHHKGYVTTLNALINGTSYESLELEELIKKSAGQDQKIFNNAAQVWNHTFYWKSLCAPQSVLLPEDGLFDEAVKRDFGGYEALVKTMVEAGASQFGSGWVWLCKDDQEKLYVQKTDNADVVWLSNRCLPLLICDVWEHAYYLDYQNRRVEYLNKTLTHLLNWRFAHERYYQPHL